VINKIDSPQARIVQTREEMVKLLDIDAREIIEISAKQGTNVEQVLNAIIERVPPPKGDETQPLRALVFDSEYDAYKGVVAFVRVFDGEIKKGENR